MKKVLFATTALVATAGVAAAELNVDFTGSSRFGVKYSETNATAAVAATGDAAEIAAAQDAINNAATGTQQALDAAQAVVTANTADGSLDANDIAALSTAQQAHDDAVAALDAIDGTDAVAASDSTELHNRFTLNVDASIEADNGVEYFSRVRIRGDNTGEDPSASGVSAPRVGMTTGGFTIAAGNISGAVESTPGLYSGSVGLTGLGWGNLVTNQSGAGAFAWDSFSSSGAGRNGLEVIYSQGDFGGHVSYSEATSDFSIADEEGTAGRTAAHVSYTTGDWTFAVFTQSSDNSAEDMTGLIIGGSVGEISVGASYADLDGNSAWSVNGSTSVGADTDVTAYVTDSDNAADTAYGLGMTHSLGGATLAAGIASDSKGQTQADLGIRFSF